jgi:alpha-glucosidase
LEFYRLALRLRREYALGAGTVEWIESGDPDVLVLRSSGVTVVANTGAGTVALPEGRIVLASERVGDRIPADTTVWLV